VQATLVNPCSQAKVQEQKIPDLDTFLSKRDYQGATALLAFKRHANRHDVRNLEWLAYAHFHFGEHDKVRVAALHCRWLATGDLHAKHFLDPSLQALNIYKELLTFDDPDPTYYIYAAACYYFIGLYKEAEAAALQVKPTGRFPLVQCLLLRHSND
jgi:intraflagellar transport protein 56